MYFIQFWRIGHNLILDGESPSKVVTLIKYFPFYWETLEATDMKLWISVPSEQSVILDAIVMILSTQNIGHAWGQLGLLKVVPYLVVPLETTTWERVVKFNHDRGLYFKNKNMK